VRLVQYLPERWQKLAHELVKFGAVGVLNTLINLGVFNALLLSIDNVGRLKANMVATVVATIFAYFMNRHWTFKDRPSGHSTRREFVLFFVFNLIGLGIESALLGGTVYVLGLTGILAVNIAKIVGLVLGTAFRFWSYRTFVFTSSTITAHIPAPLTEEAALLAAVAVTGQLSSEDEFEDLTDELERELDQKKPAPPAPAPQRPALRKRPARSSR
jgi:putative flippase GtrA